MRDAEFSTLSQNSAKCNVVCTSVSVRFTFALNYITRSTMDASFISVGRNNGDNPAASRKSGDTCFTFKQFSTCFTSPSVASTKYLVIFTGRFPFHSLHHHFLISVKSRDIPRVTTFIPDRFFGNLVALSVIVDMDLLNPGSHVTRKYRGASVRFRLRWRLGVTSSKYGTREAPLF